MVILKAGLRHYDQIQQDAIVALDQVLAWHELVQQVFVEQSVLEYLLELVVATRSESTLQCGISPRGALSLKLAAQARAFYKGRAFVLPEDIRSMLVPVCGHRLKSSAHGSDPIEERRRVEGVLIHITERVQQPL